MLVLSLLGAGFLGGWLIASDRSLVEVDPSPAGPTDRASVAPAGEQVMPDLRGLGADDGRQILADLGVPGVRPSRPRTNRRRASRA